MITAPENWDELYDSGEFALELRFTLDGDAYYNADLASGDCRLTHYLYGQYSTGNACAAQLNVSVYDPAPVADGVLEATLEARLASRDGGTVTDWTEQGTYHLNTAEWEDDGGIVHLTLYDALALSDVYLFDGGIAPDTGWPRESEDLVGAICTKIGVDPPDSSSAYGGVSCPNVDYATCREVLCAIAAVRGGNWTVTKSNQLRFVPLADMSAAAPATSVSVADVTRTSTTKSVGKVRLSGIDGTYEGGTGDFAIASSCIYADDDVARAAFLAVRAREYTGYSATDAYVSPLFELGDVAEVAGTGIVMPLDSVSLLYEQGCWGSVSAPLSDEIERRIDGGQTAGERRIERIANVAGLRGTTAQYLANLLARINGQANAAGGYAYITEGQGIRTYDAAVSDPLSGSEASKVTDLRGGYIWLGEKDGQGNWAYKTLIENGHVAAEFVTSANIVSGYIGDAGGTNYWNLDTGEFRLSNQATVDGDPILTAFTITYAQNQSRTSHPDETVDANWSPVMPPYREGHYIWQRVTTKAFGTPEYQVTCISGRDGAKGTNAQAVMLYARAPGWAIDAGERELSAGAESVLSVSGTTATISANVSGTALVLYDIPPLDMDGTVTYTFDTGDIAGNLGSWHRSIPPGDSALYITMASAISNDDADTIARSEWSDPIVLSSVGADGINQATIYLYKRSPTWAIHGTGMWAPTASAMSVSGTTATVKGAVSGTTFAVASEAPASPKGISGYTGSDYAFESGELSNVPSGWSREMPEDYGGRDALWVVTACAISAGAVGHIAKERWSDTALLADSGDGVDQNEEQWYLSTSRTACTGGSWSTAQPAVSTGRWVWQRMKTTWADGIVTYTDPRPASAINAAFYEAKAASDRVVSLDESLNQDGVMKRLTNNYQWQGIYRDGNGYYINASMIQAGYINASLIKVGMLSDTNGRNYWNMATGDLVTTKGNIGGFTIGSSSLYNNLTSISGTTRGVYVGTDGIATVDSTKHGVRVTDGKVRFYNYQSGYNVGNIDGAGFGSQGSMVVSSSYGTVIDTPNLYVNTGGYAYGSGVKAKCETYTIADLVSVSTVTDKNNSITVNPRVRSYEFAHGMLVGVSGTSYGQRTLATTDYVEALVAPVKEKAGPFYKRSDGLYSRSGGSYDPASTTSYVVALTGDYVGAGGSGTYAKMDGNGLTLASGGYTGKLRMVQTGIERALTLDAGHVYLRATSGLHVYGNAGYRDAASEDVTVMTASGGSKTLHFTKGIYTG